VDFGEIKLVSDLKEGLAGSRIYEFSIKQELLNIHKSINKLPHWVPISLIVINCILYEWVGVFELEALQPVAVLCKIVIPLFLLLIVFPDSIHFPPLKRFIYFYAIFIAWGGVSTILSNFSMEGMSLLAKYFFRFLFCVAVCLYFIRRPVFHQVIIMKVLVIIAVAIVIQYLILETTSFMGWISSIEIQTHRGGLFYGPFGILGKGTAQFSYFYVVPKFRLTGFWLEPSNSSAFLFMASFLAEALYITTQKKRWVVASGVCCVGGIFAFANGGYFALGFALFTGQIIDFIRGNKNRALRADLSRAMVYHFLMAVSIFLIFFSIFGRYIVLKYAPNTPILKAVTGIRGELLNPTYKPLTLDYTLIKRGALAKKMVSERDIYTVIIGSGLRIPGRDSKGRGVTVSASAPIFWFYFTGAVGLIILLLRESQVIGCFVSHFPPSTYQLRIFQAWIVLFFQNMAYGQWMTPLYFLLIALVFSSLKEHTNCVPVSNT
jgi:hypothetical protein